jgi:uncharacterized paraquat-inducible protein A
MTSSIFGITTCPICECLINKREESSCSYCGYQLHWFSSRADKLYGLSMLLAVVILVITIYEFV